MKFAKHVSEIAVDDLRVDQLDEALEEAAARGDRERVDAIAARKEIER